MRSKHWEAGAVQQGTRKHRLLLHGVLFALQEGEVAR